MDKFVADSQTADNTQPTSDEVIAALRDAGWLLEQDTAVVLEKGRFQVVTAKAFPDPDDPSMSREIDVHGYRELYRNEALSFSIGIRVLAECKQSAMPYVVVGRAASAYELSRDRQEQQFRFPRVEVSRTPTVQGAQINTVSAREYLGLDALPGSPWQPRFVGTQMTRLDRKKSWLADNRGIFTSLVYPLAKALSYFRSRAPRSSYDVHRPGYEWASIEFYYPLIVTSAPLFTVDVALPELRAVSAPWATMTREIKSATLDGQFNIDVVTFAELEKYLDDRIHTFALAVVATAEKDPQRFVTGVDHGYGVRGSDTTP